MQDRAVCWHCTEIIEHDPIFEAPCGHDRCPSVVFHGLCLMEWREVRAKIEEHRREMHRRLVAWMRRHHD